MRPGSSWHWHSTQRISALRRCPAIVNEWLGILLTVLATFVYAVSSLLMRRLKGVHPLTIHAWLAAISLPLLFVGSLVFEPGALASVGDMRLG
ncbi:MAG: hypothetical protein KKA05_11925, partial [Alphaproteobacteria bacterium]|nr:hypothetical protein [Alphaproteobacteria bacterium]